MGRRKRAASCDEALAPSLRQVPTKIVGEVTADANCVINMCPEPEEKTLDDGVRLRLCRGQQLTTPDHQTITGDLLEVSEPPDHNPITVWIFPNQDSLRAKRAFDKQVPLVVPAEPDKVTLSHPSDDDASKYLGYWKLFDEWSVFTAPKSSPSA
jgi:hypothetical protein